MKNMKKAFALLLTCAIVFSALSGTIFTKTAAAAPGVDSDKYVRVEAEAISATVYSLVCPLFESPNKEDYGASGGKVAGGINQYEINRVQSFDSLSTYLDRSNTPTITFNVTANEAGTYTLLPGYQLNDSALKDSYFMTVLVNDTKAYKCKYSALVGTTMNAATVDVDLIKGNNVIRLIPIVQETKAAAPTATVDYLDIDKRLTPVLNKNDDKYTFNVEEAPYVYGYSNTKNGHLSEDRSVSAKAKGITVDNITTEDLSSVSYFSYTFNATQTGYYNMDLTFTTGPLFPKNDHFYVGYMINGVSYGAAAARRHLTGDPNNSDYINTLNLTAKLEKGKNTIVVTNCLAKSDAKTETVYQIKYDTLTLYSCNQVFALTDKEAEQESYRPVDPTTITTEKEYNTILATSAYNHYLAQVTAAPVEIDDLEYLRINAGTSNFLAADAKNVPTFADLNNGIFDKSALPYSAFYVKAPNAGTYSIKPLIYFDKLEENPDYFYVISVNDKFKKITDLVGKDTYGQSAIDVELEEGINVIRILPFTRETFKSFDVTDNSFLLKGLQVEKGLVATTAASVTVKPADITYANKMLIENNTNKRYYVVGKIGPYDNIAAFESCGLTFDNINKASLAKLPYVAYTFEVPADGYYDLSLGYNATVTANKTPDGITDANGATGYFVVRIDGKNYKVNFLEALSRVQTNANYSYADMSTYLTKGTHTILASAAFDWKCDGKSVFYHSSFIRGITVTGGITKATTQVDPKTIDDAVVEVSADTITSHLEAEVFGNASGYTINTGLNADKYSGGGVVTSLTISDTSKLQSKSSVATKGFDKSANAYVSFTVNATEAGDYPLTPVYYINNNGFNPSGYSLSVVVNDSTVYDAPYVADSAKQTATGKQWNRGGVTVHLEKGINVIRLVPFFSDNSDKYRTNAIAFDYLAIAGDKTDDSEPVYGVLPNYLTLNAGHAPYISGFNAVDTALRNITENMENNGVAFENLNKKNIKHAAFFSYTVTAAADGFYDINLPYSVGGKNGNTLTEDDMHFALYKDQTAKAINFRKVGDSVANASMYLTAGDHTLTFVAQLPEKTTGVYGWTDFTTLQLGGGLKLADVQVNPVQPINRLEAEVYGAESPTYSYKQKNESPNYSGGLILGGGTYNGDFVSDAEMAAGKYNEGLPFVKFNVKADTAGKKQFMVSYVMASTTMDKLNGIDNSMKYIYAFVKNSKGTQAFKVTNEQWITADWDEGDNEFIVATYTKELYEANLAASGSNNLWVDLDYFELDDGLTAAAPRMIFARLLEGEDYDRSGFNNVEAGKHYSGGWAVSNGSYDENHLKTREDYLNCDYEGEPYVTYSIEVERAGTYALSAVYTFGTGGKRPAEVPVYLIITSTVDGSAKAYRQSNSGVWVDGIDLEAGIYNVIVTIYDKETHDACGAGAYGSTWMNQDCLYAYSDDLIDLDKAGLKYSIQGSMIPGATYPDKSAVVRLEAEDAAFPNYYYKEVGSSKYSGPVDNITGKRSGVALLGTKMDNAQTVAQLRANGIDDFLTPYVMYVVDAPAAGAYDIELGMVKEIAGNCIPKDYRAYVGLFVNDVYVEEIEVTFDDKRARAFHEDFTINLKEGRNYIKVTCATSDSVFDLVRADFETPVTDAEWNDYFQLPPPGTTGYATATANIYQDYLDIKDRSVSSYNPNPNNLEAESSVMHGYTAAGRSASGGQMACNENFTKIITSKLTLDKLNNNPDYIAFASYIEYEVEAQESGVYPIVFVGASGKSGSPLTDDVFFGVKIDHVLGEDEEADSTPIDTNGITTLNDINNPKFEKLEYRIQGTSTVFSRITWVQLKKGVNKITATCILKDIIRAESNLYYLDHDCIILSRGLNGTAKEVAADEVFNTKGDEEMQVAGGLELAGNVKNIKPSRVFYVDSDNKEIAVSSYRVNCGEFEYDELSGAEALADSLRADGFECEIILIDGKYIVFAGSFSTEAEAKAYADKIAAAGFGDVTTEALIITKDASGNTIYGYGGSNSPLTGENVMLAVPMLLLALAAVALLYALFKRKSGANA